MESECSVGGALGGEGGGGDGDAGNGARPGGWGGDGQPTAMPPGIDASPVQYSHESPSASGHCVLPLLVLNSPAGTLV